MTDRDALYRAVLASPDDDTLRLVYADALEESGESRRAVFIRSQVELSRLPEYDSRWVRVQYHERDKLFDPDWTRELELPDGIDWMPMAFRRGLPGAIQARDGAAFVAHAEELFARYPIESLELDILRVADVHKLAACEWLERITQLTLSQGASAQAIKPLLASPHLTRLADLQVGSEMTTGPAASAIMRSRAFKQLTALGVQADRAGRTVASALAGLTNPLQLKKLNLSTNRLRAEQLDQLAASSALATVEDLDLSDNNLGADGLTALAGGKLPSLRALHLLRTRPQEDGVTALVEAEFFPELRSLSLGGNNLGPSAAFAIAGAPAENLRVLNLGDNRLGDRGATSLAGSPRLANLILLDLAETRIGDAGAEALAESKNLDGLIYLNLFGNPISPGMRDRLHRRFGNRLFP